MTTEKPFGPVEVVFRGAGESIVTDFGEPLELRRDDGVIESIPRYGVWRNTGRKLEVVYTTNNLSEAIKLAKGGKQR